jgi:predicted nuclease of predicted toxin-antitoxin system
MISDVEEVAVVVAHRELAGRTVVSADTDFGELLAIGRHPGPSVILLRRAPHLPDEQAELLLAALHAVEADLDAGAVVVFSRGRACVRRLPIAQPAFWDG